MRPAQVAQLAFIAVAALGVYSFGATARDGEQRRLCTPLCALGPDYAAQNRLAPDFELPLVSGGKGKLSDYRGQVVILNFWSKTCRPCLEEMPALAELSTMLRQKKSNVVLLSLCTDESVEDARATLSSVLPSGVPFPVFVDPGADMVLSKYGTKLYPETWFIDQSGVIRARVDGARDWTQPFAMDFAQSLARPQSCQLSFERGEPQGSLARICHDLGLGLD
ncbi:MAG: TlpA family protein disulfide reductase [Polyangiaceae bacterium]|nr:TlpA family protein disulfide reductase [Polyangiaceae bacterium]MCW5790133.1 TlpA family protein disulfide reductase [Polyangiaceae bacterium]